MVATRSATFGRLIIACMLAAALIPGLPRPALAAGSIIRVQAGATGAHNGATWADAYPSLQTAIGVAVSGDQVWVAKGTYVPTTGTDQTVSFQLKAGVAIYGGFAGTETSQSTRNPATNLTILSGDIGVVGTQGDNSYHVVRAGSVSASAVLDGFKILGGFNFANTQPGSGIYVHAGSPTLRNLWVSGNTAYAGGGVGVDAAGTPTLANLLIDNNFAGGGYGLGGGMFSDASSPTLRNVTFTANQAQFGGAAEIIEGAPSFVNVTFAGNKAVGSGSGGAIYTDHSNATITDSILWGDDTAGVDLEEVFVGVGTPVIRNSIVAGGCPARASCSGLRTANPVLGTLRDNGGFVRTMAPGVGSAAIDSGSNATCATTDARNVARPQGGACDVGAFEVRVLSVRSSAANDGWILESREKSGQGGTRNVTATTLRVGDDSANRQFRSIVSFTTTGVPDAATVVRTTLAVRRSGVMGTNPFATHRGLLVDIRAPSFGSSPSLATSDFQAAASRSAAATFGSPTSSAWYTAIVSAASLGAVSKTAATQCRLRFTLDDNNDHGADYASLYSGNAGSAANRPLLNVYYVP